jgi:hypothetical protein
MKHRLLYLAFSALGAGACATEGHLFTDEDAGSSDASAPDVSASDDSSMPVFADGGYDAPAEGSCDFGNAQNLATQSSLNLFGDTTFYADASALPPGHYRITWVDGCFKYGSAEDWTVNAYAEDAGSYHWWLVDGVGGTPNTNVLEPPGSIGIFAAPGPNSGAYATFDECVAANKLLDGSVEFDFNGGPLGLWLSDSPYTDNLAGKLTDAGVARNPTWSLSLTNAPCPPTK